MVCSEDFPKTTSQGPHSMLGEAVGWELKGGFQDGLSMELFELKNGISIYIYGNVQKHVKNGISNPGYLQEHVKKWDI